MNKQLLNMEAVKELVKTRKHNIDELENMVNGKDKRYGDNMDKESFRKQVTDRLTLEKKLFDELIIDLWNDLEDVTLTNDNDKEIINSEWFIFEKGTEKRIIWNWFNINYSTGIKSLCEDSIED